MCKDLASRPGNQRVGKTLLGETGRKVSALRQTRGALYTMPVMVQNNSPEVWHHIVLNSSVVLLNFVREAIGRHDPDCVSFLLILLVLPHRNTTP